MLFRFFGAFDRPAHIFQQKLPLETPEILEQRVFGGFGGGNGVGFQIPAALGQFDDLGTAVAWMGFADDQPVALHARERIGECRLFDIDSIEQLPLGQAVLMPEFDEDGELSGRETQGGGSFLQRHGEFPRHFRSEIDCRFVPGKTHFSAHKAPRPAQPGKSIARYISHDMFRPA